MAQKTPAEKSQDKWPITESIKKTFHTIADNLSMSSKILFF